jgi:hypothetical protein
MFLAYGIDVGSVVVGAGYGIPAGVVTPFAMAKFGPFFGGAAATLAGFATLAFFAPRPKTREAEFYPRHVTSYYPQRHE